jgi:hypothetical protein
MKAHWGVEIKLHSFFDLVTRWEVSGLDVMVKRRIPRSCRDANSLSSSP